MSGRRLLVVAAVEAEREALLLGLHPKSLDGTRQWSDRNPPRAAVAAGEATVVVGGVGQAAAAATTARLLAEAAAEEEPFDLAVSAGIAGGFADRVALGGLVLAERAVAGDLGAQTPEGFQSLDRLSFGASTVECETGILAALRSALPDAVTGDVLTVATVTGTAERAAELRRLWPEAVAEAMEGFGVATAAAQAGVGFAEIRTISNAVGPRDREAWRIGDALATLERAARALVSLTW